MGIGMVHIVKHHWFIDHGRLPNIFLSSLYCIHTLHRGCMYEVVHPLRPQDFPRALRNLLVVKDVQPNASPSRQCLDTILSFQIFDISVIVEQREIFPTGTWISMELVTYKFH